MIECLKLKAQTAYGLPKEGSLSGLQQSIKVGSLFTLTHLRCPQSKFVFFFFFLHIIGFVFILSLEIIIRIIGIRANTPGTTINCYVFLSI